MLKDGLKIGDHGRFKLISFSQETGKKGQHQPRNGERPLQSVVQDAQRVLTHLPFFFLFSFLKSIDTISNFLKTKHENETRKRVAQSLYMVKKANA